MDKAEYQRKWRAEHPNFRRKWAEEHPEKLSEYHRDYQLKKMYGLSLFEYNKIFKMQHGECWICGGVATALDHNHVTGKVRAFLCVKCNVGLAYLENETWMLKARKYLEDFK